MKIDFVRLVALSCLMLAAQGGSQACRAENWPQWRGPTGVGVSSEKDLPLTWDDKTGENVVWKTSLKGTTGYSSPIVWGNRVFITTADKQTREQEERKDIPEHHVACYQANDGTLLWRTLVPPGKEPAGYAIYAVPTPATDGRAVDVWFGSAVVAAVSFEGNSSGGTSAPAPSR